MSSPITAFPCSPASPFWHRFVREDGQISIARAFIRAEWEALLREAGITDQQASVAWHIPFRLCVGDPLIIGAGPAGTAAAITLARAGHRPV